MKKARTIAEFFILQWLERNNLDTRYIEVEFVTSHRARVTDCNNDAMIVVYDDVDQCVYLDEDETPGAATPRESGN